MNWQLEDNHFMLIVCINSSLKFFMRLYVSPAAWTLSLEISLMACYKKAKGEDSTGSRSRVINSLLTTPIYFPIRLQYLRRRSNQKNHPKLLIGMLKNNVPMCIKWTASSVKIKSQ